MLMCEARNKPPQYAKHLNNEFTLPFPSYSAINSSEEFSFKLSKPYELADRIELQRRGCHHCVTFWCTPHDDRFINCNRFISRGVNGEFIAGDIFRKERKFGYAIFSQNSGIWIIHHLSGANVPGKNFDH